MGCGASTSAAPGQSGAYMDLESLKGNRLPTTRAGEVIEARSFNTKDVSYYTSSVSFNHSEKSASYVISSADVISLAERRASPVGCASPHHPPRPSPPHAQHCIDLPSGPADCSVPSAPDHLEARLHSTREDVGAEHAPLHSAKSFRRLHPQLTAEEAELLCAQQQLSRACTAVSAW